MTQIRSSARLVATCMLLSTAALPAHAFSLPNMNEDELAYFRPLPRPVGLAASDLAPVLTVRPPLRGEAHAAHAGHDVADASGDQAAPLTAAPEEQDLETAVAEIDEKKVKRSDPFEQLLFAAAGAFQVQPNVLDDVFAAEREAKRLEDEGVVDYAVLRGFVLPEDLIWRAPEGPSAQAAREMRNAIRERLASRYDLDNGNSGDIERFYAIAEGQSLKDWGQQRAAIAEPAAMKVVEARFEVPPPVTPVAPVAPKASDLRGFLNSPAGIAALAQMDAAQISALTAMLREMEGRDAPADKPSPASAPAAAAATTKGPGVPALSFRRTASSGEAAGESAVRTIGSNDNLLLRGWEVTEENGEVSLYRDDAPGSRIVVKEGMILGALGAVVEVERTDDKVRVRFESGDEIVGTSS